MVYSNVVEDPDLELRGGGVVLCLLALPAFLLSVISSFFTQNKGGSGDPSSRSATDEEPCRALTVKRKGIGGSYI